MRDQVGEYLYICQRSFGLEEASLPLEELAANSVMVALEQFIYIPLLMRKSLLNYG